MKLTATVKDYENKISIIEENFEDIADFRLYLNIKGLRILKIKKG